MAYIYAMSDIHGRWDVFEEMLKLVDFSDPDNRLILLGDYIDHRHNDTDIYRKLMEFVQSHPEQVVCLMGNHEAYFLGDCGVEPFCEPQFALVNDFDASESSSLFPLEYLLQTDEVRKPINFEDKEVLNWVKHLPVYYETPTQIFVHAGVDEDAGEYWKVGTEDSSFYDKFPPVQGSFIKDIIAGHAGVCGMYLSDDPNFHEVFWDGESHYYIDGSTPISGKLPLLKYDTATGRYMSFYKGEDGVWKEYFVEAC